MSLLQQRQSLIAIFILLCVFLPLQAVNPSCFNSLMNNQLAITTAKEEFHVYPMTKIFNGYNLTYTTNNSIDGVTIQQPLTEQGNGNTLQQGQQLLDAQYYEISNSQTQFVVLQRSNQGYYTISFSSTYFPYIAPDFSQTPVTLNTDKDTFCESATYLQQNVVVVDCFRTESTTGEINTQLYLTTSNSQGQTINPIEGVPSIPFNQRNSLSYVCDGITYLISYVPYLQFMNTDTNVEYYIDIYRYNPNMKDNNQPLGTLSSMIPLTAQDFGLGQIQIVNIQAYGTYLHVLDATQGIISFQYIANQVKNLQITPLYQLSNAWGMEINNVAGMDVLIVAGDDFLYEYNWPHFQGQPQAVRHYQLEFSRINQVVDISINADYIALQMNNLLDIYQRGQTDVFYMLASIQNVDYYQLLNSDNILVYQLNKVYNYYITQPAIVINGMDQTQDSQNLVVINATSVYMGQNITCSQQFFINFYINQLQTSPVATQQYLDMNVTVMGDALFTIPLGYSFVGPNMAYAAGLTDVELDLGVNQNIEPAVVTFYPQPAIMSTQGITADQAILSRVFGIDSNSQYVFYQTVKYKVYTYMCNTTDEDPFIVNCGQTLASINISGLILAYEQTYWKGQPVFLIVTNVDESTIQIYDFYGNSIGNITVSGDAQILDIEIANDLVYIVSRKSTNTNWIDIYYFDYGFEYYGSINQQTVKTFPNCRNFAPTNITTSRVYPGLLFIQTTDDFLGFQIVVVNLVANNIYFITNLALTIPSGSQNWQFFTTDYNLVFVCDGPSGYIQEWTFNDFTFLKTTKQYPLYGYNISTPLTAWYSPSTQLFYVMMDNATNQYQVFVFRPGVPNIMTLYKALVIQQHNNILTNISLYAGGFTADIVFLQYEINGDPNPQVYFHLFRSPQYPVVNVIPAQVGSQYMIVKNLSITYIPWNQQIQITHEHFLNMINSETYVAIQSQTFSNPSINNVLKVNPIMTKQNISFTPTGWFTGSIVNFKIQCPSQQYRSCNNVMNIHNNLELNESNIGNLSNPMDIYNDPLTRTIYVLTHTHIHIFTPDLQIAAKPIYLDVQRPNAFCQKLLPYRYALQLKLFVVLCYDENRGHHFAIPVTFMNPEPFPGGWMPLPEITHLGDADLLDDNLIVSDVGESGGTLGAVYVYQLNFTSRKPLTVIQIFSSASLKLSSLNVTSFQLMATETPNYRMMIIASSNQNLVWVNIASQDYTQYTSGVINVQQFLNGWNMMFPSQVIFDKIEFIYSSYNVNDTLGYALLLVTRNAAIVELDIIFNLDQKNYHQFLWMFPAGAYSNYGANRPIPNVQVFQGINQFYFALAYYNQYMQQVTVAVYNRTQISPLLGTPAPRPMNIQDMLGGFEINGVQSVHGENAFDFSFVVDDNDLPKLLTTDPNQGAMNYLNFNPQLVLEVLNFTFDQNVTFIPYSDYTQMGVSVSVPISYIVNPPPPSSSSSEPNDSSGGGGSDWWWILLICLGGVGLIGAAFYFFYWKKRGVQSTTQSSSSNALLKDPENQISMQNEEDPTPTKA